MQRARSAAWSGGLTGSLAALIPTDRRPLTLTAIKAIHTALFFSIAGAIVVTVWEPLRGRPTRRTALAGAAIIGESAVYVSNNQVCPLTPLAEQLGARRGSVVDIFLPDWAARRIPLVAGGAAVLALALNASALLGARQSRRKEEAAMKGWIPGVSRLLARLGWVPIVTISGRRSGRSRRVPLVPVDHDGARYLVAVRGETDWARNLAAAGGGELFGRGRRQPFGAVEVDGDERVAAATAYQRTFGRFMKGLGAPPPPEQQRVFRIAPVEAVRAA